MGVETYLAVEKVQLKGNEHMAAARKLAQDPNPLERVFVRNGPLIFQRRPLVNSLLFARVEDEKLPAVRDLLSDPEGIVPPRGFIYMTADRSVCAAIPDSQMRAFRLTVESGADGLLFFSHDDFTRYRRGDKVRVKEGPLKGVEGYIKRIRKNRRLLVCVDGVIAVATSYIPPEQLEKV